MNTPRLNTRQELNSGVATPGYTPQLHAPGIVHIGVGAFHKAHQAVYTDDALTAEGGDWRILGVSLRSDAAAEELNPQDGLFTVIERGNAPSSARIVGSIARVISASRDHKSVIAALVDPAIRIVSLTVTEKGYGIDRKTGGADTSHPAVAADLANPDTPGGVLGLIVAALATRRKNDVAPFTVLSCDNLPDNGAMLRGGVIDFAKRKDPGLGDWISRNVAFPCSMVDRITPARTPATLAEATRLTGVEDQAAIETEPFRQWVIEDNFPTGRPAWEAGGAIFVQDVAPYEQMKLRMLNGTHSMLAYAGFLSGHRLVCDVMADTDMAALVRRHLLAAAATLDPLPGINIERYVADILSRFSNPNIAHETYQIAMDGTEKLPQRIFEPALVAQGQGQPLRPYAFATAAWMRYCSGRTDGGTPYALRDPKQQEITEILRNCAVPEKLADCLFNLKGLFPEKLLSDRNWTTQVTSILSVITGKGMREAVHQESLSA